MNFLVRNQKVYEQVFYDNESHFEDIVKKQLRSLFPDFIALDFKPYVLGDEGIRRKPDLALVHRRYVMWIVVEVELEHHSLEHHVLPQMRVLSSGSYDQIHADYMGQIDEEINLELVRGLVDSLQPEIMLIVNSQSVLDKGWRIIESELNVRMTYLESYRSVGGDSIFSLSGYIPKIRPERIAGAKMHPMLNALVCAKPDSLPVPASATLQMWLQGRPTNWRVLRTADSALLLPKRSVTLRKDRNYEILRAEDGRLELRQL